MSAVATDLLVDHSWALKADPYRFIGERCRRRGVDAFEVRLLLQRTVCMTGPAAARLFYDPRRFRRQGAAPEPLRATLFGKAGVQTLDAPAHARRKAMFIALQSPAHVARLQAALQRRWPEAVGRWTGRASVVFYRALQPLLAQAACDWAGVPLPAKDVEERTVQLVSLFDDAGSVRHHLRARRSRYDAEAWAAELIDAQRRGGDVAERGTVLDVVASHTDDDGRALPLRVAAVELLNLLRPVVAVSVFLVFAARALQQAPQWRETLRARPELAEAFAQEVRRYYPFFPAVVALACADFEWEGVRFEPGGRVLLDLYGTNHDPRAWDEPQAFRPERFVERAVDPDAFVPQGGGDVARGHRCPGEAATLALIVAGTRWLVDGMRYRVPAQDLSIDMARLPALPRSGFVMTGVGLR